MPEERRGRLDHAIDRAVRDMMQVDPRPGLRHRVANRLAEVEASGAGPGDGFGREGEGRESYRAAGAIYRGDLRSGFFLSASACS